MPEVYSDHQRETHVTKVIQCPLQPATLNKDPFQGTIPFRYVSGPLTISGSTFWNAPTLDFHIYLLGTYLGLFNGNVGNGWTIAVQLSITRGELKLSVKNGKEVWVDWSSVVLFDGTRPGSCAKLVTFEAVDENGLSLV
ncbi:uncharacterized protein LY89DRAFT_747631 [Mollisia scopiformis]|uniref:Uncharacterized protein n=1 Tax=Mollisia scopiformis TaxID=149040 RepID=A0A194XDE6_MOLSC|nr:uncharacterized protein LY89DRAFT_747631 [Mollisia scopiformis]KUJ17777.1 hypothetical protein LY89DRAFT_747631 [Mollisia scopiformis]